MEVGDWVKVPSGLFRGYSAKVVSTNALFTEITYMADGGYVRGSYFTDSFSETPRQALPSYIGLFEDV